jgi:hypothetical protein
MRAKLATFILGAALIAPATAIGGGWATVGLAPPPDDIQAGTAWIANLEILQHGVTPLEDVEPKVIVSSGGERKSFAARPTGKPGVYRAEVVFPSGGKWSYEVDDGFTQTHTFPPVEVGGDSAAPAAAGSNAPDGGGPDVALLLALVAAAGVGAALVVTLLRRRPTPG